MKVSAALKEQFCEHMVRGQTPESAARAIGIDRTTAYRWRAADASFAAEWEQARERKIEAVENVLYRQAMVGEAWAVCFFLKAHRPDLYNRRQVIAVGGDPDAPPIGIAGEVVHFYMPPNHRDEPEEIDDDASHTIEGEAEGDDSDDSDDESNAA
jgi:hypothetical protein